MKLDLNITERSYRWSGNCEVQTWIGRCSDQPDQIDRLKGLLSPAELKTAGAFHFEQDAQRYICAHALLRQVLGEYTGLPPQSLKFSSGPFGKPFLSNHGHIRFSLSHSKKIIAIAVTLNREVGIDVEKCVSFTGMQDLAEKIMTGPEYRQFQNLDITRQTHFFYSCWVKKEAVVKAWGMGIDDDLCNIPVMEDNRSGGDDFVYSFHGYIPGAWRIEDIELDHNYYGALSIEEDSGIIRIAC